MRPPGQRTTAEWRYLSEAKLGLWWLEWEQSLRRHDDLTKTLAAGDNLALLARQTGLGRQKWLGEALVDADMWDSRVLVLCPPTVRLHWHQQLIQAGLAADRVEAVSAWQASRGGILNEARLLEKFMRANVVIIEPPCRPKTKLFAGLAKQVREAGPSTQVVTTSTMVWGSATQPPRYVDSCLKLLRYLDAHEDIPVCWAEDCFDRARLG